MPTSFLLKSLNILLLIIIIGTPIFYLQQSFYPYTFSKTLFFQIAVEILAALWAALIIFEKRFRPTRTPLLIGMGVFLGALALTSLLGVDPWRSFWSSQERTIGVFTFAHFVLLALVISSLQKELWQKRLFYSSIATASCVVIVGLLQLQNPNLLLNEAVGNRPGGTFGNPTFLAGYLLFHVFIALYFLLDKRPHEEKEESRHRGFNWNLAEKIFLSISLILAVVGIFNAQTRGDILGLAVGVMALGIFFAIFPPQRSGKFLGNRKPYLAVLFILAIFGATFWFTRGSAIWSNFPGLNRFQDISISDQSQLPRLTAYRAAWRGFLDRPITGWGWENFNIVFNKYYDPEVLSLSYQETRFDKPHNVFLEYLVVGGAALALAYLFLIGTFLWEAWKGRNILFAQAVTAAAIAYAVRSLFVFDTIGPLLIFFLLLGVTNKQFRAEAERNAVPANSHSRFSASDRRWVFAGVLIPIFLVIYFININSLKATYHQYWGFVNFVNKQPQKAIDHLHRAVDIWTPYTWAIKRDYAAVIAENYFYNNGVSSEEALRALEAMEEVAKEHPLDSYNHYILVDLYNQVSDIDLANLTAKAEREAAIALELSPNRQQVLFSLAKTKHLQGDKEGALAIAKQALDLNPRVADGHFYYGLLAFSFGNNEIGYEELKQAIALGRKWKNYHEPQVVANFFADFGHFDEAVALYETALSMESGDLETRIKLGIVYFFKGDRDLAKKYLEEAGREFDYPSSPAYGELKPILDDLGI